MITPEEKAVAIEMLRSDEHYYGTYGDKFLSNSAVKKLIEDPRSYLTKEPPSKEMLMGSVLHTMLLEPDKVKDIYFVRASTRNTNLYKDALQANGLEIALLESEIEEVKRWVGAIKANFHFYERLFNRFNLYETPELGVIQSRLFKGKADVIADDYCADIKTTSNILEFKWAVKKYGYDSQAFIYQELFGRPLKFFVVDKTTLQLGVFHPTNETLRRGEAKVKKGIEVYDRFFGPNATEDVNELIINEDLD